MAYWKENIDIEVRLPYITQGCTTDYLTAKFLVTPSDIWFSGNDRDSRVWKANVHYGDYNILVTGKAVNTPEHGDRMTTYKVKAYHTFDGMFPAGEWVGDREYKTRVLSYN